MPSTFSIRELGQWLLTATLVAATFLALLYVSVFLWILGIMPKEVTELVASFSLGLLVVLVGAVFAPRHKLPTALLLCVSNTLLTTARFEMSFWGAVVGGLIAVAFVAGWFHPKRTPHSARWVGISSCAALGIFIGVLYARYRDIPARPDALPPSLVNILSTDASHVIAFYHYDLSAFINHDWLWRIDAKPDVVAQVVSRLGLSSTRTVPREFWRQPPYYWPRSLPTGAEAFQSDRFPVSRPEPEGSHYFLLHDKIHNQAFVWVKDIF